MKKLGGYLGLILSVILFLHSLISLLSFSIQINASILFILGIFIIIISSIHIFINLIIFLLAKEYTCIKYKKANLKCYYQRISGLLIILFVIIHILFAKGIFITEVYYIFFAVTSLICYFLCYSHIAVSFTNALVSIGAVSSKRIIQIINLFIYAICIFMFIFSLIDIINSINYFSTLN